MTAQSAQRRVRRATLMKWLRRTHRWIGLWGAALGLLFGATGFVMNHRATMKIPAAKTHESTVQIALPSSPPASAQAMADWLGHELGTGRAAMRVKTEPARPAAWGDGALLQPARWSATFSSPGASIQAEYWVGNRFVTVRRAEHNLFALLNNLHKGNGLGIGWVLLIDTLAGAIVLLSLSGVALWALTSRRRMAGLIVACGSAATAAGLAIAALT